MLIDSHCHLNFPDYADDLPEVVSRAEAADIGMMLSISTRLDEAEAIGAIAARYPQIVYSVGVHPHEVAAHADLSVDQLVELSKRPKVVGLGETGLDFFRDHEYEDLQRRCFLAHIGASRETGLPVIIHSRAADSEMAEILRTEESFGAVMHCFTASLELARVALDCGLYISLSGIVTFKNAEDLREVARYIPDDRLLIETDAPYLAPVPHRGKRNEPALIVHTAAKLAELKSMSYERLTEITSSNFYALFTRAA